ncbi:unnamed protein product [Rhizoctonia solani]|uniref:Jacalin-type lectin domain-containing protein n=1 Tax=Rhizoctonia solani TaxID=456999 RepID=A0A8H2XKD4_9AGAM|nr:unnamed protein product [Rhizoctonia solani]
MSDQQNSNDPPAPSNDTAYNMLEELNVFYGVTFDKTTGPHKSSRRVAGVRPDAVNSVRVRHDVSIEDIYPANEVDARSIHIGWPALSELPARPSDAIYDDINPPTKQGNWASRRLVAHRYTVSLRPQDLEPSAAFVKEVENALNLPTDEERLQELRDVCSIWGKWIATDMVIGASLAVTGALPPNQKLTGNPSTSPPQAEDSGPNITQMIDRCLDITNNFEKRFDSRIQGGYPEIFSRNGFDEWLSNALSIDNSSTWEVVKVNQAVPILSLLPGSLQEKIRGLGNKKPPTSHHSIAVGRPGQPNFRGDAQGIKDIRRINVWHNTSTIQDISIEYADRSVSGPYGYGINKPVTSYFSVAQGEFITDVFCWAAPTATPTDIVSIQFAKNTGQASPRYGLPRGTWDPYLLNGRGDALLGLSGIFTNTSITQIQPIWRDDVAEVRYRENAVSHTGPFTYYNEVVSNDYEYLRDPFTTRISKIEFTTVEVHVCNFRVTYSSNRQGDPAVITTPPRGLQYNGTARSWTLTKDEFIKRVRVRQEERGVTLLEFHTNKGVTQTMGVERGNQYNLVPPQPDMVLYYFIVSSDVGVRKMSFVWGAPPRAE